MINANKHKTGRILTCMLVSLLAASNILIGCAGTKTESGTTSAAAGETVTLTPVEEEVLTVTPAEQISPTQAPAAASADKAEPTSTEKEESTVSSNTQASPTVSDSPTPTPTPAAAPDAIDSIDEDKLSQMIPIFNEVLEANKVFENNPDSDPFWYAVHCAILSTNIDNVNDLIYENETTTWLPVSSSVTHQYAAAVSAGTTDLPDTSSADGVKYDKETDQYLFTVGDVGEDYPKITNYSKQADGSYLVDIHYSYYDGSALADAQLRIVKNTYSPDGQEPTYAYAVKEITKNS